MIDRFFRRRARPSVQPGNFLDRGIVNPAPMGEPIPVYWSPGVIQCTECGCPFPEGRSECPRVICRRA